MSTEISTNVLSDKGHSAVATDFLAKVAYLLTLQGQLRSYQADNRYGEESQSARIDVEGATLELRIVRRS
jgi:hypothetical protein